MNFHFSHKHYKKGTLTNFHPNEKWEALLQIQKAKTKGMHLKSLKTDHQVFRKYLLRRQCSLIQRAVAGGGMRTARCLNNFLNKFSTFKFLYLRAILITIPNKHKAKPPQRKCLSNIFGVWVVRNSIPKKKLKWKWKHVLPRGFIRCFCATNP